MCSCVCSASQEKGNSDGREVEGMSEINYVTKREEVISKEARNVMKRQNAVLGKQEGSLSGAVTETGKEEVQDSLYISREAQILFEQMENIRESNEKSADTAEKQGKCMLIAMRIAAGDDVPEKDIKFLIKYNSALYAKAMQMRIPKKDPEEYDSVLSDEEEKELQQSEFSDMLSSGAAMDMTSILEGGE